MSSAIIIKVQNMNFENQPTIEISLNDFIELVDSSESTLVFKGEVQHHKEDAYFFLRNGIALYTQFVDVSSWTEFKNQNQKMNDGGFTNYEDFSEAYQYGVDSDQEYQEFKKSEFFEDRHYRDSDPTEMKKVYTKFLEFSKSGYQSLSAFNEASMLGASTVDEYNQFKSSEWSDSSYYQSDSQSDFIEFKDAMKKGFSLKEEYDNAIEIGFNSAARYSMFIASGLDSKEAFDYMMNVFPSIVESELTFVDQIKSEANAAFKENRHQESVLKDYLYAEKLLNLAFTAMYKRKIGEKDKYDALLKDLKKKHDLETIPISEFHRCRMMRNSITHENYKVTSQEASSAKKNLEDLGVKLKNYINTTIETQFQTMPEGNKQKKKKGKRL